VTEANLILDHDIMGWLRSALQRFVWLHVEVPQSLAVARDMTVNNDARFRIERARIGVVHCCRVETGVMALADDLLMSVP
jgi:hypothetical protein